MRKLLMPAVMAGVIWGGAAAAGEAYPSVKLLETGTTVAGETIAYPTSGPAKVTALVVTIAPGTETVLHHHPAPMLAYILDGEVTVDYGSAGKRTFHAGESFMEAMVQPHKGINTGTAPVRILAVSMGAEGTANVAVDK
ncbi:MAG: cupin domain-containing protein [Bacteroidota bacterium]